MIKKIKLERLNRKTGVKENVEIYDTIAPYRLDEETHEEYITRRSFIKQLEKKKKRSRNLHHVSTNLIPKINKKGEIELENNKPIWIGKTKGITYIKQKENEQRD